MIASRLMVDAIPHAHLVVIPDAGHSPQTENPTAWIAALIESQIPDAQRYQPVAIVGRNEGTSTSKKTP